MKREEAEAILEQLQNGELRSYQVNKTDFSEFRSVLMERENVKDFRGYAKHGGEVIYCYEPGWSK